MREADTKYSEIIKGDTRNFKWGVRFDISGDGFLGITQFDGAAVKDRVLLSPAQVKELRAFTGRRR